MWSHLNFNFLRYKLLHPFYRRRLRGWKGKKLALDLTFGTCLGQNSSPTIFPHSSFLFITGLCHRERDSSSVTQKLWEQKVQRVKSAAWTLTNCQLLPNPLLRGEWGQGLQTHLMLDSLPLELSVDLCDTSQWPLLQGLSYSFPGFSLFTDRVAPQRVFLVSPRRSWQMET